MFKLLKNGICYAPQYLGKKDILIVLNKICKIDDTVPGENLRDVEIIDCTDKIICPGFIDQHLHITGGGGEEGFISRIPEIKLSEILVAGITTVVGVLGFDSITRNIAGLLAKARALEEEGLNTYIYTGSYEVPTATITGKAMKDITLIDKIIGIGEIAISDHRSSHPTIDMLREVAYEARLGGLLSKKAGIVHIHVGDGKNGLRPLKELIENSDFPIDMFIPTHLNRNKNLFHQAIEFANSGGNIDLTAGQSSESGYSIPDAMELLLREKVAMERVTVSSDGNGSIPSTGSGPSVGKALQLFEDIRICILDRKLDLTTILKTVSENVAKRIKLFPGKGTLAEGSDGDILIINKQDFSINSVIIGGEKFVDNGLVIRKGFYEDL
ncbi:beta-aspartyl-peptidase [Acetivibrio cellulolyticus]|uniref:beta-aspartyl-peptidase n=1 Tax=Acetivibrio cellulolyticus TaxID=35830 RepID=UPI0001E2DEEA|nr:beta-aspartyl-peptidase [Acetivibrio cellulolyticus]